MFALALIVYSQYLLQKLMKYLWTLCSKTLSLAQSSDKLSCVVTAEFMKVLLPKVLNDN